METIRSSYLFDTSNLFDIFDDTPDDYYTMAKYYDYDCALNILAPAHTVITPATNEYASPVKNTETTTTRTRRRADSAAAPDATETPTTRTRRRADVTTPVTTETPTTRIRRRVKANADTATATADRNTAKPTTVISPPKPSAPKSDARSDQHSSDRHSYGSNRYGYGSDRYGYGSNRHSYSLDRSSKKYVCPKCGRKSFVLYVDEDGKPLDDTCGRCDRADKCAHHLPPREFFKLNGGGSPQAYVSRPSYALSFTFATKPSYLPVPDPNEAGDITRTTLFQALSQRLQSVIPPQCLKEAFDAYFVRCRISNPGCVEFYQIDRYNKIRTAKVMGYDTTGHRNGKMNWRHCSLPDAKNYNLRQCYFGTHLLKSDSEVWLFESEKTALIVSAWLRHTNQSGIIPLATGGCGNLNPKSEHLSDPWHALQALRGRVVRLFPDKGKYEEWSERASHLQRFCKSITIDTTLETDYITPTRQHIASNTGDDLADLILRLAEMHLPFQLAGN